MQQDTRWETQKPPSSRNWHGGVMLWVIAIVSALIGVMLTSMLMPRAEGEGIDWTITLIVGIVIAGIVLLVGHNKHRQSTKTLND